MKCYSVCEFCSSSHKTVSDDEEESVVFGDEAENDTESQTQSCTEQDTPLDPNTTTPQVVGTPQADGKEEEDLTFRILYIQVNEETEDDKSCKSL